MHTPRHHRSLLFCNQNPVATRVLGVESVRDRDLLDLDWLRRRHGAHIRRVVRGGGCRGNDWYLLVAAGLKIRLVVVCCDSIAMVIVHISRLDVAGLAFDREVEVWWHVALKAVLQTPWF